MRCGEGKKMLGKGIMERRLSGHLVVYSSYFVCRLYPGAKKEKRLPLGPDFSLSPRSFTGS